MASTPTALTAKVESGTPYQLSEEQVLKASKALLKHMKVSSQEAVASTDKKSLLADEDDDDSSTPIWLILGTKKHIVDKKRLKPSKIAVPHSINSSGNSSICLITADPQRTYKDIVASPEFPATLGARITKVVGINKIKRKHTQYEQQRKLKAEHDIFLADDRIIVGLPKLLGKSLYKGTSKRPIPVSLSVSAPKSDGKNTKRTNEDGKLNAATPKAVAAEIERALSGTSVYLSPSSSTAIKIGYSNWDAQKLAENVEAAATLLIEKHVPQKWRGVKGLHIKGESTAALPIWLADELWVDENDVLNEHQANEFSQANVGKKRKAISSNPDEETKGDKKQKIKATGELEPPSQKQKLLESNDDNLNKEIMLRKATLRKQKDEAAKDVTDEVPKASKKSKKGKGVAKA